MSKKANVHKQSLRLWLRNKDQLIIQKNKHNRFKNKSSKETCECSITEKQLKVWVVDQRDKGCCIDGNVLIAKAKQLYNEIHPEIEPNNFVPLCHKQRKDFQFSRGWLDGFLRRRELVLRRITSAGRDLPSDSMNRINIYFTEVICSTYIQYKG